MERTDSARPRTVVFVLHYPISLRDEQRFGLKTLTKAGFSVAVWDVSKWYFPAARSLRIEQPQGVTVTKCMDMDHFRRLCITLTSGDVVFLIGGLHENQLWRGRHLIRLISSTPAELAAISSGHIPMPIELDRDSSNLVRFGSKIRGVITRPSRLKGIPTSLVSRVFNERLRFKLWASIGSPLRKLDSMWVGTMPTSIDKSFIGPLTRITYIHTLDYDLALELEGFKGSNSSDLIFVDSMGPTHPDYYINGVKDVITMAEYSELVCRALDGIERQLHCRVLVAAHPRALPGTMDPWYGGRDIAYGTTAQLIANAGAVIVAEGSTAIGLAVIFHRPLVLLTSHRFNTFTQEMNLAYSRALDTPLMSMDASELPMVSLRVSERAYKEYIQRFIKRDGTPEQPFWSVVASELRGANSDKAPSGE